MGWVGWDGLDGNLCRHLLYEHRFVVLIEGDTFIFFLSTHYIHTAPSKLLPENRIFWTSNIGTSNV